MSNAISSSTSSSPQRIILNFSKHISCRSWNNLKLFWSSDLCSGTQSSSIHVEVGLSVTRLKSPLTAKFANIPQFRHQKIHSNIATSHGLMVENSLLYVYQKCYNCYTTKTADRSIRLVENLLLSVYKTKTKTKIKTKTADRSIRLGKKSPLSVCCRNPGCTLFVDGSRRWI